MKLSKKKMVLMSFMLFSLFFGAGNLIFPPFLGQNAGEKMPFAIAAFLIDRRDPSSPRRHRCGKI